MAPSAPLICPKCAHEQRDKDAGFCAKCRFPLMLIAGKYRLQRLLGEGGFGYVYVAEHVRLQQESERVVKIIKPEVFQLNDAMKVRFEREVQMTSLLSQKCQHIVRIYDDFGEIPELGHFYVMEYLQGEPVSAFLQNPQQLPPLEWCVHVFGQLCDAMRWAHEGDIVHRDLKPDNLMMINYGDEPHFLKVLDFGIAKPTDEVAANAPNGITQGLLGTPIYMAPELFGEGTVIDYRVDIYAMGIILYEMLTGEPPFSPIGRAQTSFFRLLNSHLTETPPSMRAKRPDRNIPEALEAVVMKALDKDPDGRFGAALSFKQAVYDAIGHPIDGPALSISRTFAPAPPQTTPRSGEVMVNAPLATPNFTPSRAPDPLDAALGIGTPPEEATSVRPSRWERMPDPAPGHTPQPGTQPPGVPPYANQTPQPIAHTPLPLSLQGEALAPPSQSGLPDMSTMFPPGNTPFPALHPPVAPPHSQSHNPSHTGPSIAAEASKPPKKPIPPTGKHKLLKAIAGSIGGLLLGLMVLLFLQSPSTPDPPSETLRGSAPPIGDLPSLPGTQPRRSSIDPQQTLRIAPLNVRPLAPAARRSRRSRRTRRDRRAHKTHRRRRARSAAPKRTTCPPKRNGRAWHRIKFTPRRAELSVQTSGHSENEHLRSGVRCIWFHSHRATLKIQRQGYKTCYIEVKRLSHHLNLRLRKTNAPNTDSRDYCRFLH